MCAETKKTSPLTPDDITKNTDHITKEETARGSADIALGARIDTEETARGSADIALGARIDANKDAINTNRSGIAMSVALAHLPTIKGGGWGIAAGSFDSETAIAVGAHFDVQQNAFIKIGAASSGGETIFGIGYGKGF